MKSTHSLSRDLSLALRAACWGGALVAAIAYAVLIPMKTRGLLPPEITWIRLILGPAFAVGLIPAYLLVAMWFPKRVTLACWSVTLLFGVAVLIIIFLDSGFHACRP